MSRGLGKWRDGPTGVSLRKVVARTPLHQVDGAGRDHLAGRSAPAPSSADDGHPQGGHRPSKRQVQQGAPCSRFPLMCESSWFMVRGTVWLSRTLRIPDRGWSSGALCTKDTPVRRGFASVFRQVASRALRALLEPRWAQWGAL